MHGIKPTNPLLNALEEAFELGEEYGCDCCPGLTGDRLKEKLQEIADRWFF